MVPYHTVQQSRGTLHNRNAGTTPPPPPSSLTMHPSSFSASRPQTLLLNSTTFTIWADADTCNTFAAASCQGHAFFLPFQLTICNLHSSGILSPCSIYMRKIIMRSTSVIVCNGRPRYGTDGNCGTGQGGLRYGTERNGIPYRFTTDVTTGWNAVTSPGKNSRKNEIKCKMHACTGTHVIYRGKRLEFPARATQQQRAYILSPLSKQDALYE